LVKKREELVKPLQDKVFDAIQKVAKSEGYSFIFDKASGVQMLYADARFDKTYEVLIELGVPIEEESTGSRN
jgi:outer membrane protein